MKKLFNWKILLVLIVFFAAILRFWQLGMIPEGFHGDESEFAYNAYSIYKTGKDANGQPFPLILKSWGDYKPAIYAYLTIPWIALFDLNPFTERVTTAIFGVLSVALLFFVTDKLFQNKKIALLASFFLAISPWHLNLSRTTSEVVVSVFFLLCLIYALLRLQEKFYKLWFIIAVISGILAAGSYTASRFFVILITLIFAILWTKIKNKKFVLHYPLVILFATFLCFGIVMSMIDATSRFQQINIFSHPQTKLYLEEQIREDQGISPLFTRVLHNKVVNLTRTMLSNYGQYFTLDYLFLNGGSPQRIRVPDTGLFYLWQIPFLLLGLYVLLRKKSKAGLLLVLLWLTLLLPASTTYDEIPNVYRSLIVLPSILIIIAIGVVELFSYRYLHKTLRAVLLFSVLALGLWEFVYYEHQYYRHDEVHQPWYREYPYKPLMKTLLPLESQYKKIVVTKSQKGASIAILFWSKFDPATYQADGSPADKNYSGFGKYIFDPRDCPLATQAGGIVNGEANTLYINKGECPLPKTNVKLLKTITWQDGHPAFQVIEYLPNK